MKIRSATIIPLALFTFQVTCQAQIYSGNIVGYVNSQFYAGANLFSNPLDDGDNSLDTLFSDSGDHGPVNGTTVSLWNPVTDEFSQSSLFESGSWSTNLVLLPGTGAELIAPQAFVNIFLGTVESPDGTTFTNFNGGPLPLPPFFSGPTGTYLLRPLQNPFEQVIL